MKTHLVLSSMVLSTFLASYSNADAATSANSFNTQQVQQIETIVHDYLVNNPQVLVEASEALRTQMQQNQEKSAMGAIKTHTKELFSDANSPVAGNPQGTVTLVEFFDYQCGHCKEMSEIIESLIQSNKNLRVVFKEMPIFGGASEFAAKAALASQKQGKFLAFHNALMKAGNPLSKETVMELAKSTGLNTDQLTKDMSASDVDQEIKNTMQLAQDLQLMGTPAFVLANRAGTQFGFIPGATSQKALEAQISKLN